MVSDAENRHNDSSYPLVRPAEVVDVADEEEKGKVKVRIIPELNEVSEDLLPWVRPRKQSETGVSAGVGEHNVPDVGSIVLVVIYSEDWSTIDYTTDSLSLPSLYPYEEAVAELDAVADKEAFEYPQPAFRRTKDGVVFAHDTEQGQLGLKHPSGLYVWIGTAGELFVKEFSEIHAESGPVALDINAEDGTVKLNTNELEYKTDQYKIDNGNVQVSLDGDVVDISASDTKTETTGDAEISAGGNAKIDGGTNTEISAGTTVKVNANTSIELNATQITIKTPDSAPWQPSIIPNCLFTGAPHGGPGAGIVNLKGS